MVKSGVWEAVGVPAKGVTSGNFDSSITSGILGESYLLSISAIFLEILLSLEAESSLLDWARGFGKATGVVALFSVGAIITFSVTSILIFP